MSRLNQKGNREKLAPLPDLEGGRWESVKNLAWCDDVALATWRYHDCRWSGGRLWRGPVWRFGHEAGNGYLIGQLAAGGGDPIVGCVTLRALPARMAVWSRMAGFAVGVAGMVELVDQPILNAQVTVATLSRPVSIVGVARTAGALQPLMYKGPTDGGVTF